MNTKYYFFVLSLLIITTSCDFKNESKTSKNIEEFTINGYLQGISAKKIDLYHNKKKLQTAQVINNTFSFTGRVVTPMLYTVTLDSIMLAQIIVENTTSHLFISPNTSIMYGGKEQEKLNEYKDNLQKLQLKNKILIDSFTKYKVYQRKNFVDDIKALQNEKFAFSIKKMTETSVKAFQKYIFQKLLNQKNTTLSQLTILKNHSTSINPKWGVLVDKKIREIKEKQSKEKQKEAKKKMLKRKLAPVFTGESLNGFDLTSSDVLQGKKRILIDFWASWCGPCRQITPQVKYLYQKFKNKGFDIITVSEDKTKDEWKNAVEQDGMTWHHIYDDDMRIAYMFNVLSIPHMILLDERGGIIKDKISLSELERELKNSLGDTTP